MADTPEAIKAKVTGRIQSLYLRETEGLPQRESQRQWAIRRGLDPQKYNTWWNGVQPDYDALLVLEEKFGIPWQWFVVGDDGAEVLRRTSKRRKARAAELERERQIKIANAERQAKEQREKTG